VDEGIQRIWQMIAALSDARWKRIANADSPLDALLEEKYPPEGDEEKAIWSELTAPHNYASLRRYVEDRDPAKITEYALRFHQALLAEASRRIENGK
jgi:hypothetical protein